MFDSSISLLWFILACHKWSFISHFFFFSFDISGIHSSGHYMINISLIWLACSCKFWQMLSQLSVHKYAFFRHIDIYIFFFVICSTVNFQLNFFPSHFHAWCEVSIFRVDHLAELLVLKLLAQLKSDQDYKGQKYLMQHDTNK